MRILFLLQKRAKANYKITHFYKLKTFKAFVYDHNSILIH